MGRWCPGQLRPYRRTRIPSTARCLDRGQFPLFFQRGGHLHCLCSHSNGPGRMPSRWAHTHSSRSEGRRVRHTPYHVSPSQPPCQDRAWDVFTDDIAEIQTKRRQLKRTSWATVSLTPTSSLFNSQKKSIRSLSLRSRDFKPLRDLVPGRPEDGEKRGRRPTPEHAAAAWTGSLLSGAGRPPSLRTSGHSH